MKEENHSKSIDDHSSKFDVNIDDSDLSQKDDHKTNSFELTRMA
jgi:hypothetical protein